MADLWEQVGDSEVLAVHAALLPSGKVLYFSGSEHDETPASVDATRLWNPGNGRVEYVPSPRTPLNDSVDLFCCGHCMLPGGEILVAGGTEKYDKDAPAPHGNVHHFTGISSACIFDWRDELWHYTSSMSEGRWYPTLITLHDGRVLAMSGHGSATGPHENTMLEVFDPTTANWSNPFTVTSHDGDPLEDTGGHIHLLGATLARPMVYYPRLHLLPNHQVFSSTALRMKDKRMTRSIDLATRAATVLADPPPGGDLTNMSHVYSRAAFASVLLPLVPPNYGVRILICGEQQARLFEPNNAHLGWQNAGSPRPYSMRAYLNAVILPDATVLVLGGAMSERGAFGFLGAEIGGEDNSRIGTAERYHPDTNTWELLSFPKYGPIPRVYHSVALLLPDGRVWIAGSNHDSQRNKGGVREDDPSKGDARELRMEVYSPSYLFAKDAAGNKILDGDGNPVPATRPVIQWAPAGCAYSQEFEIHTATLLREGDPGYDPTGSRIGTGIAANQIRTVALIRCSSTTHAFNPDQRFINLVIGPTSYTSLTVRGPPSANIAPPGYYLLFILNHIGTPSVARFFKVSSSYPVVDTPTPIFDFPVMEPGKTREATFSFQNVGVGQLKLREAYTEGDFRDKTDPGSPNFGIPPKLKNTEIVIAPDAASPGNACIVKLKFTPTGYGVCTGALTVLTNAPDAHALNISLTARMLGLKLVITPSGPRKPVLAFGDVLVGTSKTLAITVQNAGDVDAIVSDMTVSEAGPHQQFHVPFVIPDRVIPVNGARTFNVTYIPTFVGPAQAAGTLVAEGTYSQGHSFHQNYTVALTGQGIGPIVSLAPINVTFANQLVGTVSVSQPITLRNDGTAPLAIANISAGYEFAQTTPYPARLDPGRSCNIAVEFKPAGAGKRRGMLIIESNAVSGPHTVALEGTGLAEPIASISTVSLDFGNQPVSTGGAEQRVILKNNGAARLQIASVTISGGNTGEFVVTSDSCRGNSIPPEGKCEVSIQFRPSVTGSRSSILEFTTNAQGTPHQVALSGMGTTPPPLTLNPTALAFGNHPVGSKSSTKTAILTNNGLVPLTLREVRVIGVNPGDFGVTADICRGENLAPGATCYVNISFSPTEVGARTANLEFIDNTPGSPQTLLLEGTGIGPALSWEPASLVFPPQIVGTFSQRLEVTLRNSGNALLIFSQINVSNDFSWRALGNTSLPPGGFCPIQVVFSPTGPNIHRGSLRIVSNAVGSPHQVSLTGEGVPTTPPTEPFHHL